MSEEEDFCENKVEDEIESLLAYALSKVPFIRAILGPKFLPNKKQIGVKSKKEEESELVTTIEKWLMLWKRLFEVCKSFYVKINRSSLYIYVFLGRIATRPD